MLPKRQSLQLLRPLHSVDSFVEAIAAGPALHVLEASWCEQKGLEQCRPGDPAGKQHWNAIRPVCRRRGVGVEGRGYLVLGKSPPVRRGALCHPNVQCLKLSAGDAELQRCELKVYRGHVRLLSSRGLLQKEHFERVQASVGNCNGPLREDHKSTGGGRQRWV